MPADDSTAAWIRSYAFLALRIDRQLTANTGGTVLIFTGPDTWRAEEPPSPRALIDETERLREQLPFTGSRARYLEAQLRSLTVTARTLVGADLDLGRYATECLGVDAGQQDESVLAAAHERLAAALTAGQGTLSERLHQWQIRHSVPSDDALLPIVDQAIAKTRERTQLLVDLPQDAEIDRVLAPGAHRGAYEGSRRGTISISDSVPFNLADLLYVVAHEGWPGHIAESMLKEINLIERRDLPEHRIRFMLSPSFVASEGIGLSAPGMAFPADAGQAWLHDAVFRPRGLEVEGSDIGEIQAARNDLWTAWSNAAFLVDEGRPDQEIGEYLRRWALLDEPEVAWALNFIRAPGMGAYVLAYAFGWRLVQAWLDHADRVTRFRQLLIEPMLPADLA